MISFFRVCLYICFALIAFTLFINFVDGLNAFPVESKAGMEDIDESNALSKLTGLSDDMSAFWLIAVGGTGIGAIALAWLSHSITPVGIHIFSTVFWTSYTRANGVLNTGGYIPDEFLNVFLVLMLFVFIGAVVSMLTGGN